MAFMLASQKSLEVEQQAFEKTPGIIEKNRQEESFLLIFLS